MSALAPLSYDPDLPDAPQLRRRQETGRDAILAGGFELYRRFVRNHNAASRWDRMPPTRRQVWIDDFEAGLSAWRAAGGR